MSLVALGSAKGAPGVSTLALALAANWPGSRPVVVVEADPAGSAFAPRFGLSFERGVTALAPAARHRLCVQDMAAQFQRLDVGEGRAFEVLVGTQGPEQARVLTRFWERLADLMSAEDGFDFVADCGRLGPGSPAMSVASAAGAAVVVLRPDVESTVAARLRLDRLGVVPAAVVTVGDKPYKASDVAEVLGGVTVTEAPLDPRCARALSGEAVGRRRIRRSPLWRAAQRLAGDLEGQLRRQSPHRRPDHLPPPVAAELSAGGPRGQDGR